ncbi:MAG: glutathione S-transferase family protein [Gammaproteobacteria bacterium]|nr:glutathione S-transferase family protein [Gammaproteobacteria bacterium]
MAEIILHHYALSPFSEKIRRVLAYKGVPWRAVEQPIMMPKPELVPLTGGNRRIPAMQVGADVYCDTACIARRIEQLHPERPVIPQAAAGTVAMIEDWADHRLFMFAVPPTILALFDDLPPGFIEDRRAMSPGFSREAIEAAAPHALEQALHAFDQLDAQLARSPYLLGADFTLADAAAYHPVRFMQNAPELAAHVAARPALADWCGRIAGFGEGKVTPLSGAEALAAATAATPADVDGGVPADAPFAAGDTVCIVADDYGPETTVGRLVRMQANEVVVLREDAAVGEVAVHYPRAGYVVSRA